MNRLEQIKNELAKEKYSCSWIYACSFMHAGDVELLMNEVARRYATEMVRHNLERAANQAQMSYHDGHHKTNSRIKYFQSGADHLVVDMESITSLEIELI